MPLQAQGVRVPVQMGLYLPPPGRVLGDALPAALPLHITPGHPTALSPALHSSPHPDGFSKAHSAP